MIQDPKHVWILDEGSHGHLVQSRGLIRELSKSVPLHVSEVPVSCALPRRISRSLVKRLLRHVRCGWMFRVLHPSVKQPGENPDLIISSGPHSLAALEFLAKQHGCPSVFLQGTLKVPKGAVTAIMRPFEGELREDYIFIPLLFTEITPKVVEQAAADFLKENAFRPQGPLNTLFIGNSSAKIRFTQVDWERIARFVNDRWQDDATQWLITTSYRTGRELEQFLKQRIAPEAIFQAVWYSEAPHKISKAFLGLADRVFVTMDSLTMLTEAVASGRQAYALCPAEMKDESPNTHLRYIQNLAENGLIARIQPGSDSIPPNAPHTRPDIDYSDAICELLARINWNA